MQIIIDGLARVLLMEFDDFQVVRSQSFVSAEMFSLTLSAKHIRFSSACVRKLGVLVLLSF